MAVAIASRQQAYYLLEDIHRSVQQCKIVEDERLEKVAWLLHCKNFHRFQAPAVAKRWSRVVSELSRKEKEQLIATRTTRTTAASTIERPRPKTVQIRVASSNDLGNGVEYKVEFTAKLARLIQKYCRDHDLDEDVATFYFKDEMVSGDDTPRSLGMRKGDILEVCEYESEPESELDSDDDTHAEVQSEPEPARFSHVECCICTDGYEDDQDTWECEACENRAHADCFAPWAKEQRRNMSAYASCPYCRARVSSSIGR